MLLNKPEQHCVLSTATKKPLEKILEEAQLAFSGKMPESNSFQLGFYKKEETMCKKAKVHQIVYTEQTKCKTLYHYT